MPASLREVITQRAHRLGPSAVSLLSLAAVVGVENSSLAVLIQVADVPEDEVLDLVEAAERSALLTPNGDGTMFAFDHASIRNTLYDALPPARRRSPARDGGRRPRGRASPPAVAGPARVPLPTAADDRSAALHYAELALGAARLAVMAADEAVRWFKQGVGVAQRPAAGAPAIGPTSPPSWAPPSSWPAIRSTANPARGRAAGQGVR